MDNLPGSSYRFRKEKKMGFPLNVEDFPYDAMGDYSAFRLDFSKEVPKEEAVRDAGSDPAVSRGTIPGQARVFQNKSRT